MDWVILIVAGAFEVLGVISMNRLTQKKSVANYALFIFGFASSFSLLSLAMDTLPLSVAYAVWTGIGTVGGALVGMLFYKESKDLKRILCIAAIVIAVVGLRLFA